MTDPTDDLLARLVRPLAWEPGYGGWARAQTARVGPNFFYQAERSQRDDGSICWHLARGMLRPVFYSDFPTLEAAKAAAEADHRARVAAALNLDALAALVKENSRE